MENNEHINNQIESDYENLPKFDNQTIDEYLKLKKLAFSYWNIFAFSLCNCLFYPIIRNTLNKQYLRIPASIILSLFFYKSPGLYFAKTFNKDDYQRFNTFCLKNGLQII